MTRCEIRTTDGKVRTVVRLDVAFKATDSRRAIRLLEDECEKRDLSPDDHAIRLHDRNAGWITHGGTR